MGAVFFFAFLPVIVAILAVLIIVAIVGIAIFVVGVSGSIVSATVLSDKKIKAASLSFFSSLLFLGLSCLVVLGGILFTVYYLVAPLLVIVGIGVIVLGIIGIIRALGIDQKVAKVALVILLSLSATIGMVLLGSGIIMLILG